MQGNNLHAYAYRDTKVKTSSQGQIIVMLYDAALRSMDDAVVGLKSSVVKFDQVNNAIMKARDVITELLCALDVEKGGVFAERMFALYMWFNQQLLDANMNKDPQAITVVRDMMADLRDAWAQIVGRVNVEGRASGINIAG